MDKTEPCKDLKTNQNASIFAKKCLKLNEICRRTSKGNHIEFSRRKLLLIRKNFRSENIGFSKTQLIRHGNQCISCVQNMTGKTVGERFGNRIFRKSLLRFFEMEIFINLRTTVFVKILRKQSHKEINAAEKSSERGLYSSISKHDAKLGNFVKSMQQSIHL